MLTEIGIEMAGFVTRFELPRLFAGGGSVSRLAGNLCPVHDLILD